MRRRMFALAVTAGMVAAMILLWAGPASAHEDRAIGPFDVAVGFGQEPAYAGQENSVQMIISTDGEPLTDLGETLQVEVGFGDATMPAMTMEPNFEVGEFGTPGDYRAFFFPTRPGSYSFHFTGTINGQQMDETFTSGPNTFSDVQDPGGVQFPVKDPTTGEVAARIDREVPRLQSSIEAQARSVRDDARGARTLAAIAIVVGGLGFLVGAAGLAIATRRARG